MIQDQKNVHQPLCLPLCVFWPAKYIFYKQMVENLSGSLRQYLYKHTAKIGAVTSLFILVCFRWTCMLLFR